jgi:hypothetical protein
MMKKAVDNNLSSGFSHGMKGRRERHLAAQNMAGQLLFALSLTDLSPEEVSQVTKS